MDRYRPKHLDEFVGQRHLLAPKAPFLTLLKKRALPHSFFYGPPGTGKTTLARIVANLYESDFFELNATSLKIEEIRNIVKRYKGSFIKPILFIDEVHRLSKNQQEVLLPIMEKEEALILGASTENPFFSLTAAIRSRSMLFEFKPLSDEELQELVKRVCETQRCFIDEEAKAYLIRISQGDARNLLKFLTKAAVIEQNITIELLRSLAPTSYHEGSSTQETHYALASALIKSIRGSDVDAALYYLARLIEGGEPPEFIARRLVIFASEDIGNANPNALNLATSTMIAVKHIGYPEARIILSQCVIYLASSPKSNAAYKAINKAMKMVEDGEIYPIPEYLKPPKFLGYKYPHDYGGWVEQAYTTKPLKIYESSGIGYEKRLLEWLEKIKKVR
ncbi:MULTISPECIES: replication-associated recombination protein A [unclassified Nitratiruptor]|uniref:replication-associated recombination protein A n=1 Tax=unclassified Nitratiruptor TaxID=2624044 RepID=UPI0019158A91|nr:MULTISPECIES: replication-associated recombination protein A [unclassified Nitratiruptor]BCD59330.1 ATPase, AAA family [Nitratiruptor sp. YY08-10]BCD63254.1 ATPase, AAA family [Nitratiruptor sp. YY08-14]